MSDDLRKRAEQAEATIARVHALHQQWVKAGPPPLGVSLSRWWDARLVELHHAILAQAAARAYPDRYRLMGGTQPVEEQTGDADA